MCGKCQQPLYMNICPNMACLKSPILAKYSLRLFKSIARSREMKLSSVLQRLSCFFNVFHTGGAPWIFRTLHMHMCTGLRTKTCSHAVCLAQPKLHCWFQRGSPISPHVNGQPPARRRSLLSTCTPLKIPALLNAIKAS